MLAQLIGLKMETEGGDFEADSEGLSIAAAINSNLPEQVPPCLRVYAQSGTSAASSSYGHAQCCTSDFPG